MKKIYSIVLMAAALLVGTNVWADDFSVVNHTKGTNLSTSDLQAAIDFAGPGDSITITLNSIEHELTKAVIIPNPESLSSTNTLLDKDGQIITLNLNGNKIKGAASIGVIQILKGNLHIIGGGQIVRGEGLITKPTNCDKSAITVYGAPWRRNTSDWTTLTIGENVKVSATGEEGVKVFGVTIQNTSAYPAGVTAAKLGYVTYYSGKTQAQLNQLSKDEQENQPIYGALTKAGATKYNAGCAYGVKIIVKGEIEGNFRGINVLGTVNAKPQNDMGDVNVKRSDKYPYFDYKYPYIKVEPTAEISCRADGISEDENGGIYGGGYAVMDISGHVHGQTGICLKAGDVDLQDAIVESDSKYTGVQNPDYHKGEVAGSAIFIADDVKYAGGTGVAIGGDTKLSSGAGSESAAIVDMMATNTENATTSHVSITGGTIEGGISLTVGTAEVTTVYGGNISGTYEEGNVEKSITTLVPADHHVTVVEVDGKTTVVISEGDAPEEKNQIALETNRNQSVKWTGATELIDKDFELAELEINQTTAQVCTIASGKTLTVGRVVLGEKAQIIVEAGGKFIVTGEQGIVAPVKSNIILKIEDGKQAIFLFNPGVTSNRNPSATVALKTKSYWNGDDFVYERMGVPAASGMTLNDIKKIDGAANLYAIYWNANTQKWAQATNTQHLDPFMGLGILSQSTTAGNKYNFPCQLLGNSDVELNLINQWNFFANSYMAELDLTALATAIKAAGEGVAAGVYLDLLGNEQWDVVSFDDLTEVNGNPAATKLNPMQGFILNNQTSSSATAAISYENMMWDPIFDPNHETVMGMAARHNDDLTRVKIMITAANGRYDAVTLRQSEKYTAEYENGSDFEKYMGINAVDFYATTELGNLAQVAMNDIEGLQLSVASKEAASYKMTFTNVLGEQLAIRDNLTGSVITMTEDAEYFFSAAEGTNANRFEIVSIKNAATDVETIVEATGTKAVYTILGQYMGTTDNWNELPNGIYVVDGVKMVK